MMCDGKMYSIAHSSARQLPEGRLETRLNHVQYYEATTSLQDHIRIRGFGLQLHVFAGVNSL